MSTEHGSPRAGPRLRHRAGRVTLHLATGWRYGLFRDEFYYLACAIISMGYVDHPPLSIRGARAVRGSWGDCSSWCASCLRCSSVSSCAAACLARELVGDASPQSSRPVGGDRPQYLALTGFYSMNAFDLAFWAVAVLLLARLVRTDDVRLWRPLGLVVGLGLLNKISLLFFAFGLGVAVLATPLRRHLKRHELWKRVLGLLLFMPYGALEMKPRPGHP